MILLTDNSRFQIDKHSSWYMLARRRLTEECVEGIDALSRCIVTGHQTIWLYTMLQTVELPAGVAHLDTGLTDMD